MPPLRVGIRLVCIVMYIFYFMFLLQGNVLSAEMNDSMLIRDGTSSGGEGVSSVLGKMVKAMTS